MSPLNIEAVYERIPALDTSQGQGSLRWGFRATFASSPQDKRTPKQDQPYSTAPLLPAPASNDSGLLRTRPSGSPRHPREAADPDPDLLGYNRQGKPVPLDLLFGASRTGSLLDLRV